MLCARSLNMKLSSDYVIYNVVYAPSRRLALILLGSSYVTLTYQVRPFSNSVEAIVVALSLLVTRNMLVDESLASAGRVGALFSARLLKIDITHHRQADETSSCCHSWLYLGCLLALLLAPSFYQLPWKF